MIIITVVVVIGSLFMADNQEFFNKVEQDIKVGNQWYYVGEQDPDPYSLSITSQVDGYTAKIYWKLKK